MTLSVEFSVCSPLWRGLRRARALARETLALCVEESGVALSEGAEVGVLLADDERIRALNARWRALDKPTNVLSFPASQAGRQGGLLVQAAMLGDIALSYETLAREAERDGVKLADHYRHLLAHGFLHLIGYDHETEDEAERMEALERRVLARLGVADPYGVAGI